VFVRFGISFQVALVGHGGVDAFAKACVGGESCRNFRTVKTSVQTRGLQRSRGVQFASLIGLDSRELTGGPLFDCQRMMDSLPLLGGVSLSIFPFSADGRCHLNAGMPEHRIQPLGKKKKLLGARPADILNELGP